MSAAWTDTTGSAAGHTPADGLWDEADPSGDAGGKRSNERLTSWFERSGWSKGELARRVNRRARALGAAHVSTDTTRVRRWLDGEQPREPIPRILAELFSERFGCVVAVEELGLRDGAPQLGGSGVDLPWNAEALVEVLSDFTRSDLMLGRHGSVGASLALSAGPSLVTPMQRWLSPTTNAQVTGAPLLRVPGQGHISDGELAQLEAGIGTFRTWDLRRGGGLHRKAVVGQLHGLAELLDDEFPPHVRERLFRLTAELAQCAGWMSYDVGIQPTAQKYFVLGLHAARQAGDRPLGAHSLGLMGRQMIHLGRADDALDLVRLAQYGSADTAGARVQAMLYALESRAHASLGHADRCRSAALRAGQMLAEAQRTAGSGGEPAWIGYFDEAQLHAELGSAYRDLAYLDPGHLELAHTHLSESARLHEAGDHTRSHALVLVELAGVRLLDGDVAGACAHAEQACAVGAGVRSERLVTGLRRLVRCAAASHGDDPRVVRLEGVVACTERAGTP